MIFIGLNFFLDEPKTLEPSDFTGQVYSQEYSIKFSHHDVVSHMDDVLLPKHDVASHNDDVIMTWK